MVKRINTLILLIAITSVHGEESTQNAARFNLNEPQKLIDKRRSVLAINKRTYGPFGKNQDPNAKPPPPPKKEETKAPVVEKTPELELKDLIGNLKDKVNAAGNNMAIINGRRYLKGDTLKLEAVNPKTRKKQVFEVQLARATSSLLAFRNTNSGEFHYLQLGGGLNLGKPEDLKLPESNKDDKIDITK
ncbi:hypothetical protein SAMN02745181_3622 [Rubritalea squalenifaciens DSM 18772]|uniref:Uncharacterized protein n=1 Tax=Rubritalea squalenifaciens DSM 18772 TaxID=1123071 RepID=A0A1M6RK27_9BACT|nr:hypothetical protein [Rubritalea squalenifaciens]SHK32786.1 hypothetical protein SAMN02745181_3622 [Rubritalea squalenifaciens DSM 18772]